MNKHQEKIDLLEQYMDDTLTSDQKISLEKELSENAELAKEFEQHKLVVSGIKFVGRKNLYQRVRKWDEELAEKPGKGGKHVGMRSFKWYYAAAAVVFFVLASILIYYNLNSGYDRLVADYYKPYNYIPDVKRGEKTEINSVEHIFEYYDRGEYRQTIQLINGLEPEQLTDLTDFISANAHQAMENYHEAAKIYQKIVGTGSVYAMGSKWYLALCYLSLEKPDLAKPLLENLKGLNTSYASKAQRLLEELD